MIFFSIIKFVGQSKMLNSLNNTAAASPISARERAAARPTERPKAADHKKSQRSISKRHEGPPKTSLAIT